MGDGDHGDEPGRRPRQVGNGKAAGLEKRVADQPVRKRAHQARLVEGVHDPVPKPVGGQQQVVDGADRSHGGVVQAAADVAHQTGHPGGAEKADSDHAGRHGREQRAEQQGQAQQDHGLSGQ